MKIKKKPIITSGQDWNFELIEEIFEEIEKIATNKYGLNVYPTQLEIITSEQMLDAYTSVGMPISYPHWSFGESFVKQLEQYKRGHMGLAYEIVINSNPCIAYLMEENTALMQTLVIAHASFGHNTFFKNNYLFKQWTQPDAIIDYLAYAKKFIRECEEQYGIDEVEEILDAVHALKMHGVDKYKRPPKLSAAEEEKLIKERNDYNQSQVNAIWNTIPTGKIKGDVEDAEPKFPSEPQENILYFIEKNAPRLENWKREIIRIVRMIAQYFYPQMQTQVMNEGCLVEGSLINTESGLMDIKELVKTKYSGNVWDGEKWEKVYDWFTHSNKKRIRITTDKGYEIFGGYDHKIQINNSWVKLSDLNLGDEIDIRPSTHHIWPTTEPTIDYDKKKYHNINEIPEILFKSTKNSVKSFLQSYFDADGCATKDGKVILVSKSKQLISQVQELLLYFNIFCGVHHQQDDTYHLNIDGINALYFRDEIGFGLLRKQERLFFLDNKKFLTRKTKCFIKDIEIDEGTTYDFSVNSSHKYYHKGLINHNCATYFHYKIVHDLYNAGVIDESAMFEFTTSHTNVVLQPDVDDPRFNGINPYALGFAMMRDIERISLDPTDEDIDWFKGQEWVGSGDYINTIKFAIGNFKDESFIKQYLSPKVIRDFKLFAILDDEADTELEVSAIHNSQGYKKIREALSIQYNIGYMIPDIQVVNVDKWGDRTMTLQHFMVNDMPLHKEQTIETLKYLTQIWGYNVRLESITSSGDIKEIYDLKDKNNLLDIFLTDS